MFIKQNPSISAEGVYYGAPSGGNMFIIPISDSWKQAYHIASILHFVRWQRYATCCKCAIKTACNYSAKQIKIVQCEAN